MDNGIDKKALFKFKSEPYLRPISDLKFGFYNLDENTAKLRFQLYNKKGNLLLSENNINAYAYFESANGSATDVEELEIIDELNGIVGITLSKEFLEASTSTKVKGQVYIGVNNVENNPDYNEVAVFREFTFEVKDALINKISSFTKIEYIRMFDQLKMRIEQQVKDIEEAIANGADYVAEMQSVLQRGVETLNAIVASGKTDIQTFITQAKTDLTKVKDDATEDITTTANNAKTSVQDTASTAVNSIDNKATEATEHVDTKVTEFNQTVKDNGFLTPDKLTEDLTALDWQKYKLLEDDGVLVGSSLANDVEALHSLETGMYYRTAVPIDNYEVSSKAGFLTVVQNNSVKHIVFRPYNSTRQFLKRYYQQWKDWEEITNNQHDTGWITFDLINGAKSNTAYKSTGDGGFDCAYRIITNGSETKRLLRINGTNLVQNQVIAQLPSDFVKNAQTFPIRVPLKYAGGYIAIRPSGEVRFYINGGSSEWSSTDYAYGQCQWID